MKDFFPIETPYDSEDYKLMKSAVNMGIDSHLEGFTKSEFKKSPHFNNKFLWNIHNSELPILYRRLADLYEKTGNEDYDSLLNDIQNIADKTHAAVTAGEDELEEVIDPIDLNQITDGEQTATSDLAAEDQGIENYIDDTKSQEMEMDEAELREMIRKGAQESLGTLGLAYDKKGSEFPDMEENSSDSLANKHGENLKPETLGETTDTERYEDIVFSQGEEASEVMDILNNDGEEAAMEHLKQWHYPGEHMGKNELGHGSQDEIFTKDGYIMAWNPYLPYIGLSFDTQYAPGLDEDSQMKRHQAGQREKTVPLGQHASHSQIAKNNGTTSK